MKKMMILILAGLVSGFVMTVVSTTCMAAEEVKPITLKWSSPLTENSWYGQQHKWWANEVEKRTGGKVKFQIYWMDSLTKIKDALPAVQNRFVDMAQIVGSYHPSNFPLLMMTDAIFNSREDYVAAILAFTETITSEPNLKASIESQKVVPLFPWHGGALHLGTKKCMNSLKDLKGKSIRCMGGLRTEFYKELGGKPVFISWSEMYEALDRGTIDVIGDFPIGTGILILKLQEVAKCIYMIHSGAPLTTFIFMNADVFKGLPKDVQDVMINLRREYGIRYGEGLMDLEAKLLKESEEKYGVTLKYPSPEDQKMLLEAGRKANEAFIKQQESSGHTAAGKVMSFYMDALKKYENERAKKK
jgi:TRAP-type transport system periplasmic protein